MAIRFEDKKNDDGTPAPKAAQGTARAAASKPTAPAPADGAEPEPQLPFAKPQRPEKRKKR